MNFLKIILLGAVVGVSTLGKAQSLSPEVVSTAGGTLTGKNVTVNWTIGEAAIARWETPTLTVTEGFHQPLLKLTRQLEESKEVVVSIAPNPVQATLNVVLLKTTETPLFAQLVDVQGRVIIERTDLGAGKTELSLHHLASGVYFLSIAPKGGKPLEVFKVLKTN